MDIDGFRKKNKNSADERVENFFRHEKPVVEKIEEVEEYPTGKAMQHPVDALVNWQAPEFEVYDQDRKWLIYVSLVLVIIIGYAVYQNSLIMAITFILIGVVGYIYIDKEPRTIDFAITHEGVIAGREIFEYENIKSFWIFYEPEGQKVISLHMDGGLMPYIHIPIHDQNPVQIREALLINLHEIKQGHNFIDTLERFLRI